MADFLLALALEQAVQFLMKIIQGSYRGTLFPQLSDNVHQLSSEAIGHYRLIEHAQHKV